MFRRPDSSELRPAISAGSTRATAGRQPRGRRAHGGRIGHRSAPVLSWFALTAELLETLTVELCEEAVTYTIRFADFCVVFDQFLRGAHAPPSVRSP